MSESVTLPALGESVTEGTVTRWLKQVGETVEVDEPLLEVSTDKVDTEIPSPVAGVVEEILVAEDETVEVGTALVRIGDGAASPAENPSPAEAAPEAQPQQPEAQARPEAQQQQQTEAQQQTEEQPEPESAPDAGTSYTYPAPEDEVAGPAEPSAPQQAEPSQPAAQTSSAGRPGHQDGGSSDGAGASEGLEAVTPSSEAPIGSDEQGRPGGPPAPAQPDTAQVLPERAVPAPAAAPEPAAPAQPAPAAEAAPSHAGGTHAAAPYVTPIVRKLAHDRGVDLNSLTGSGVGGRIRKEDVLVAAEPAGGAAAAAAPDAEPAARAEPSPLRGTTVKMSRLRKVVAERAVVSMQSTAQLTTVVEVDVTAVAAYRDRIKGEFQSKTGQKLSFLPFFALAAVEALQQYPIVNATVDGDSIVYPDTENLSIAVDTERGLLTPVIRNAGGLSIAELAGQIADLASRTRENKLKPDELAGGTFTLTNTGSRGALFDTPVVFLPQVAILGTGVVVKRPAVVRVDGGDAIAVRSTVYLALSYDHRIVDGADAARFLVAVKARLEAGDFADDLGI